MLVKIHSSALCGSERKSYYSDPSALKETGGYKISGHEMAGEVVDPGDIINFKSGDKIVVQIFNGCGICHYCRDGLYEFCRKMTVEGGTHAEYISLPEKCVIKAPDGIPYDLLVLLGGDTIGVAKRAVSQLNIKPRQFVFVSGAGPIGLGISMLLKHYVAYVAVSEFSEFRREYIKEHANVDLVLDPAKVNIKNELYSLTDDIGPEIIIECSGNPSAQLDALKLVRCQGTVVYCGENNKGLEIIPTPHIIHKEVLLRGAFYFTASDFYDNIALYKGGFNPSGLISHKIPLKEAPLIIDQFFNGLTGKVIFHPQEW